MKVQNYINLLQEESMNNWIVWAILVIFFQVAFSNVTLTGIWILGIITMIIYEKYHKNDRL